MKKERFTLREPDIDDDIGCSEIADNGGWITYGEIVDLLNTLDIEKTAYYSSNEVLREEVQRLENEIKDLKFENNMLRTTISRNEAYIANLLNKGKWDNTSDKEVEWLRDHTVWEQMPSNRKTFIATTGDHMGWKSKGD